AGGVEDLHAVVARVRHQHVTRLSDRNASRSVELSAARARPADDQPRRSARGREALHAAVARVGDVEVAPGLERQRGRELELARPLALRAPGAEDPAVGSELDDAVV